MTAEYGGYVGKLLWEFRHTCAEVRNEVQPMHTYGQEQHISLLSIFMDLFRLLINMYMSRVSWNIVLLGGGCKMERFF